MPRNLFLLFALLVLVSCGEDSKHFKIEGRLLQMNQGEFYVYSNDQCVDGIDTIKVQGGRFSYEIPCSSPSTLTIVFPNFSETRGWFYSLIAISTLLFHKAPYKNVIVLGHVQDKEGRKMSKSKAKSAHDV